MREGVFSILLVVNWDTVILEVGTIVLQTIVLSAESLLTIVEWASVVLLTGVDSVVSSQVSGSGESFWTNRATVLSSLL